MVSYYHCIEVLASTKYGEIFGADDRLSALLIRGVPQPLPTSDGSTALTVRPSVARIFKTRTDEALPGSVGQHNSSLNMKSWKMLAQFGISNKPGSLLYW